MLVLVPTAVFLLGFAFPTDLHARGPPNSSQGTTGGTLGRGPDRRRYWVPSGKPAVGSDMFLTAKHAFIVGFFLIDIPGLAFRMALLLHGGSSQGTLLCPFLLKNLTWICLRPLQMHQCVLAEKEDASCHQREVLTVATDVPRQIRAAICATGCPATGADGVPTRRDGVGIPPACCFEEPGLPAAAELHQLRNHMGSSSTGDAEDATAVAAAAAAAVRERQQAFLLNLLDIQTLSSLISNEASFYSAPADVAEAHTQDTASPAATVTSAAAGGRGHSASTVSEVQQPAYKRPLQRFMTHGPLRFFMLRTKQQEDQQASAVSDLATGAVTEEPKAPPLGRAFTLSRWKRQHKGKDQHNLFRNYRSVILPPSAVRTGANGPAKNRLTPIRERAATTVAPATTADQQFPLPFSKRLGERLASLRAFRGRRRSTVPSCSKKQGEQQPEQPEDPKDLLSRGKSRHPPAHSQQAPQYKPQQQRGDDPASPGKEMIDGALLTFGRRPEKAPRLATGGFSPRGPEQTLDLAQSCTMHRHGHAPCRDGGAAFALEPYDACQGLAETAPTAGTAQSGSCSKIPLGWLQLDTFNPAPAAIYTAPLAAPTAQMNGQKSKQPGDLFPHELSCLASRTLWLLDALRRQQWELLQEGFPVKRIGFSLLLKRLLILLLRPRGRGFAAVTDSGVHISRKQQLLLAFVAIFTHLAKLLLVLHPFISTLIAQQQQLEERLHEEESLVQKAPGELLLMGEGGLLLLILISLLVLLQATLYLCLSVPFLDTLFVAVGGCLSLASLQGLLATIETLFHSPHRSEGPPKRNPGAPGVDIWFIELPVAEILLRLVLCAPPFFSLLQLILPVCSLLCLRSTVACSWQPRSAATLRQQSEHQYTVDEPFTYSGPPGGDDPAVPAGTAGVLLLLLCSSMGAPLSLHALLVGGPLLRSVRLCDQLLQHHFDATVLLLCSRGITAGWAPNRLLLVVHFCYFCFCCCYMMLSCSVRLLQLRRCELLLQMQLLLEPLHPAMQSQETGATGAAVSAGLDFDDAAAGGGPSDTSLHGQRAYSAAAAVAVAPSQPPYILLSEVHRHLQTEGFFSFSSSIWPPCWAWGGAVGRTDTAVCDAAVADIAYVLEAASTAVICASAPQSVRCTSCSSNSNRYGLACVTSALLADFACTPAFDSPWFSASSSSTALAVWFATRQHALLVAPKGPSSDPRGGWEQREALNAVASGNAESKGNRVPLQNRQQQQYSSNRNTKKELEEGQRKASAVFRITATTREDALLKQWEHRRQRERIGPAEESHSIAGPTSRMSMLTGSEETT
ncbi:uncharacterized protein LOC113147485 [Cyclospora cayetanensis]|uniref:Uncharacterized protein LOC113147485 n=1 Tax=Cyclospora cayetanensis TaxID=88456 RepID=A0A6P6S1E4_9EIME|nr:uncharacterized protein LOC113147485 [Cyclospora cayetanensis]